MGLSLVSAQEQEGTTNCNCSADELRGLPGLPGIPGLAGASGNPGSNGDSGTRGPPGSDGETGLRHFLAMSSRVGFLFIASLS